MTSRKLLLVTYHFPPSGACGVYRMLGLVRHLPKYGWEPVVVAPPTNPWEPVDENLSQRVPPQTAVLSVPFPGGIVTRVARRFVPNAVWLPRGLAACARAVRRHQPEAVVTSGPPHCVHMLGWYLKRRYGLPWVADFRDPWFIQGKAVSPTRWAGLESYFDETVMRTANVIVANAPHSCEEIQSSHPAYRHKVVTITNGYDPESFPPRQVDGRRWETLRITYAGELYAGRDPRSFLDALRDLQADSDGGDMAFRACFVGRSTDGFIDLGKEVRQRGLEQIVELLGQVSYERALRVMTQADILLLLLAPGSRFGVPAKLYEYLGAGRPILALVDEDGDADWVLKKSGVLHRIAPSRDPAKIKQALVELARELAGGQYAAPSKEQLFAFTRAAMAQELAEVVSQCLVQTDAGAAKNLPGLLTGTQADGT